MAETSPQPSTFSEQIAIVEIGKDAYVSKLPPQQMGNTQKIAFGGCTTAVAVYAAAQTVKDDFNLYSCMGYFLGPSLVDRPVKATVYRARDTKSFATRRVVLSQTLPGGSERNSMEIVLDFQRTEPATFMNYSPPTVIATKKPEQAPEIRALRDKFVAEGKLSIKTGSLLDTMFALMGRFFEQRLCTEGVTGQTLAGFGKNLPTTQDHLGITDKFSAEWFRARQPLESAGQHWAALAFNMDGGLSFLPLMHDHKFLEDVGACSSLDFALRIFTPNLNMNNWHFKERKTIAAEGGRTYSEARLFDDAGNLVAIENQQSIMRPLPAKNAKL